jgi:hypothetical protein
MCVAEDLEYYKAIFAGTWPTVVEQLTVALKNSIRIKNEDNKNGNNYRARSRNEKATS